MARLRAITVLLLSLLFSISLIGCAPDSQTQSVIDKINSIGEVTLSSEDIIEDARNSYNSLSQEQKDKVDNFSVLEEAERQYSIIQVIDAIDAIEMPITLESEESIRNASSLYSSLKMNDQDSVSNYAILEEAKKQLEELKEKAKQLQVGETVTTSKWNITLDSAELTESIVPANMNDFFGQYVEAPEGKTLVSLIFTAENISNSAIKAIPISNIKIHYGDTTFTNARVQLYTGSFWIDEFTDGFQPFDKQPVYVYADIPIASKSDDLPVYIELNIDNQQKVITIK